MKPGWTSAAAGTVLALALSVAPAHAAQSAAAPAESCGWFADDVLTASGIITKRNAAVHNGPAARCRVTDHRPLNSRVEVYCWYVNDAGNLWYSTTFGWIYRPYVEIDRGAPEAC